MSKLPDPSIKCPATGFEKNCRSIIAECDCPKYIHIAGTDPNTGQPVDKFGCVDAFLPMLLIENSQQQRQTAAAVESFRNEMVQANEASQQALMATLSMASPTPRSHDHRLPQADQGAGPVDLGGIR